MPYLIYLPPGYDSEAQASYPVLYMLHGLNGDRFQWQLIGLFKAADALIASNEITPMIIVVPEGNRSYWVDHANNGPRWGTFVAQDLVNHVDARYRTRPYRQQRAIGGLSMGGHGALQIAMNSNQFSVVGAHSVALRRHAEAFSFFGDKTYFEAHDPVSLCLRNRAKADSLKLWLDMGAEDVWHDRAVAFHEQLRSQSIDHEWHVFSGGHDLAYWQTHTPDYLKFYSSALASSE